MLSQSEELKILRRIVDLTSTDLALSRVLKEVVSIVVDAANADSVFIYLFSDDKKHLTLKASHTPHKKELDKVSLKVGEGITGWVAKENTPVSIKKNAYEDSRFINFDVLPEDKYEAFLSMPIVYKKKAIGVINVQHKEPNKHAKRLVELLDVIADLVGGVIENARLLEQSRSKVKQFESLFKVSETIRSESYLDEILNLVVVVASELLETKVCSLMLVDEKRQNLVIRAAQSLSDDYSKRPALKISQSLSGDVLQEKKTRAIYDVKKEKKYAHQELAQKENFKSLLMIPMIYRNQAIGIINIYTSNYHEFSKEEIHTIEMIANQAAVSIQNTQLFEEMIKAREALETRKVIERAKGALMKMHNLDEQTAYKMIHKKSMDSCRSMKEVAEAIILTCDL